VEGKSEGKKNPCVFCIIREREKAKGEKKKKKQSAKPRREIFKGGLKLAQSLARTRGRCSTIHS